MYTEKERKKEEAYMLSDSKRQSEVFYYTLGWIPCAKPELLIEWILQWNKTNAVLYFDSWIL